MFHYYIFQIFRQNFSCCLFETFSYRIYCIFHVNLSCFFFPLKHYTIYIFKYSILWLTITFQTLPKIYGLLINVFFVSHNLPPKSRFNIQNIHITLRHCQSCSILEYIIPKISGVTVYYRVYLENITNKI
jgi:hypothetical protein